MLLTNLITSDAIADEESLHQRINSLRELTYKREGYDVPYITLYEVGREFLPNGRAFMGVTDEFFDRSGRCTIYQQAVFESNSVCYVDPSFNALRGRNDERFTIFEDRDYSVTWTKMTWSEGASLLGENLHRRLEMRSQPRCRSAKRLKLARHESHVD